MASFMFFPKEFIHSTCCQGVAYFTFTPLRHSSVNGRPPMQGLT